MLEVSYRGIRVEVTWRDLLLRSIPIFRILVAVDRRQSKLTTADAVGSSGGPLEVARVTQLSGVVQLNWLQVVTEYDDDWMRLRRLKSLLSELHHFCITLEVLG